MSEVPAYEREPYRTELSTEVSSIGEVDGQPFAVLEDTILYPGGGGQPADRGSLNGIAVLDVRRSEDGIRHLLERPAVAGPARLELDWQRRFDHMQQHTAQHLLSAVAADRFGWATTSFHLGARRCDIELDTPEAHPDHLAELEELVAGHIRAARPVTGRRLSPEEYAELAVRTRGLPDQHRGDVRLVEIEGVDVTTCGGTHLRSTAEIEALKLDATEPMRGGTRLYWLAGRRVRRRLAELEARNHELRQLFETSGGELATAAAARLDGLRGADRALRKLTGELAEARSQALVASPSAVVDAHFDNADAALLQRVARELLAQAPDKAALLTATGEKGSFFVVAAGPESSVVAADAGPRVAELLDGRGGGSGPIFQGKAKSLERRSEAVTALRNLGTG